jgi:hypothetical protein
MLQRLNLKSQLIYLCSIIASVCLAGTHAVEAASLRATSGPYCLEVLLDGHYRAPQYYHQGQHFVLGSKGSRYTLRIHNRSAERVEAVISVDGRDVLDGKRGSYQKRGYLISAYSHIDIDGWRLSNAEVAAFRFSNVRYSYAAMTGDARDVGVIGVAIFPERHPEPPPVVYSPTPRYESEYQAHGEARRDRAARKSRARSSAHALSGISPNSDDPLNGLESDGVGTTRPGLGTEFGEVRYSSVRSIPFERGQSNPAVLLGVRYNDRQGLLAQGIDIYRLNRYRVEARRRLNANPFPEPTYLSPPDGWKYR